MVVSVSAANYLASPAGFWHGDGGGTWLGSGRPRLVVWDGLTLTIILYLLINANTLYLCTQRNDSTNGDKKMCSF